MSNLVFFTGEQPIEPLIIQVRDDNGEIIDLSNLTSVALVGSPLPDGSCVVVDAVQGKVAYDFDAPFTDAGVLTLQVEMAEAGTGVDLSAPFTITVVDPAMAAAGIASPAEVLAITGSDVTTRQILQAQSTVGVVVARNLNDAAWLATISSSDAYWLRVATAYQAAGIAEATPSFLYVPGASSVTTGDISISYRENAADDLTSLTDHARMACQRLSWMRGFRSVQAQPFSLRAGAPDPWRTISVSGGWR